MLFPVIDWLLGFFLITLFLLVVLSRLNPTDFFFFFFAGKCMNKESFLKKYVMGRGWSHRFCSIWSVCFLASVSCFKIHWCFARPLFGFLILFVCCLLCYHLIVFFFRGVTDGFFIVRLNWNRRVGVLRLFQQLVAGCCFDSFKFAYPSSLHHHLTTHFPQFL